MLMRELINVYEILDRQEVTGEEILEKFNVSDVSSVKSSTHRVKREKGTTDFIKMKIKGRKGKLEDGKAPTLGIVGRLGGTGARPEHIGTVSDADGAIVALSCALKLIKMTQKGDTLPGDVVISTHICPDAPTQPHEPVSFMDSPVDIATMNEYEVSDEMEAVLSVDATKGNKIINQTGFAISPTLKEGYILRVSEDLLDLMELVTGELPVTLPITMQDITPYGNGVHHINSIMQPATATDAPVVGIALISGATVPGVATGANYPWALESAARFCVEVAKNFGQKNCEFFDKGEFSQLVESYGSMKRLTKK